MPPREEQPQEVRPFANGRPRDGNSHGHPHPEDQRPAAEGDNVRVPTHYAPRTGKSLIVFAVVVAVALCVGFFIVQHLRNGQTEALDKETAVAAAAPPVVDVIRIKASPSIQALALPGETSGWYESTIYARVNGYVGKWVADFGDHVTKGQLLATIETPELDAQLGAAQAKLNAAQAQVEVQKADTAFAQTTYQRWKDSPKGVVSDQEREEKKAQYLSSVAKLDAAQAQVRLSEAEVQSLVALTQFKQVTAPFDGVITLRRIDLGDLVTAGSTANTTALYRIAQSDTIRVFVDVPQDISSQIVVGAPATVDTNESPSRQFHGKVARTAQSIDTNSRTLHVEVDVPNPNQALVPGMYVQVRLDLVHRSLPEVPASALLFRSNGIQVAVVGDDGKVTFRDVTIAMDQGNTVELGSGVAVNDRIALNISSQIADGEQVTSIDVEAGGAAEGTPAP